MKQVLFPLIFLIWVCQGCTPPPVHPIPSPQSGAVHLFSKHLCTGALITKHLVLTDYKCLRGYGQKVLVSLTEKTRSSIWKGLVMRHTPEVSIIFLLRNPPLYFTRYGFPSVSPQVDQAVQVVFYQQKEGGLYKWRSWDSVSQKPNRFLALKHTKEVPCGTILLNQAHQLVGMWSCVHKKFWNVYNSYQRFKRMK